VPYARSVSVPRVIIVWMPQHSGPVDRELIVNVPTHLSVEWIPGHEKDAILTHRVPKPVRHPQKGVDRTVPPRRANWASSREGTSTLIPEARPAQSNRNRPAPMGHSWPGCGPRPGGLPHTIHSGQSARERYRSLGSFVSTTRGIRRDLREDDVLSSTSPRNLPSKVMVKAYVR
jgi:hypothetical protein